jgi:hypothetical protein
VLGNHIDERQDRRELAGRRIAGGVQQREKPLSEPQRIIISHTGTPTPGQIIPPGDSGPVEA